jgi:hypothetical protein
MPLDPHVDERGQQLPVYSASQLGEGSQLQALARGSFGSCVLSLTETYFFSGSTAGITRGSLPPPYLSLAGGSTEFLARNPAPEVASLTAPGSRMQATNDHRRHGS